MDLLQVGDGEDSSVWGGGGPTTAAVQRGQMACKDGAKAQEILVTGNPQRAFREGQTCWESWGSWRLLVTSRMIVGDLCLQHRSTGQCGLSVWDKQIKNIYTMQMSISFIQLYL